jgi:hypothetical protein
VCTLAAKRKIRAGFDMSDQTIPLLVVQIFSVLENRRFLTEQNVFPKSIVVFHS